MDLSYEARKERKIEAIVQNITKLGRPTVEEKLNGAVGHPALCILRKCENQICVQVGLCRLQRLMENQHESGFDRMYKQSWAMTMTITSFLIFCCMFPVMSIVFSII